MDSKWLGAALILLGCGMGGFSLAAKHRYAEYTLEQLIRGLEFMTCELQFRVTPLPELCCKAAENTRGLAGQVLFLLSQQLDRQENGNVSVCMEYALKQTGEIPEPVRENLRNLGSVLGRFDLDGQLKGLDSARRNCQKDLEALTKDRESRLHSYRTLGVCAGAAMAILLI